MAPRLRVNGSPRPMDRLHGALHEEEVRTKTVLASELLDDRVREGRGGTPASVALEREAPELAALLSERR
jgi:hypothetical protein